MPYWIYDGSTWKPGMQPSVYDGGAWKGVEEAWIYDSGSWNSFFINARYLMAIGGTVTTTDADGVLDASGDYKTHTFTGSGTFTIESPGNAAGNNTYDIAAVGGGGGGDSYNHNSGNGGATTVEQYNAADTLQNTYTAAGGDGGSATNHYGGVARLQANGSHYSGVVADGNGDDFSGAGFTADGGVYVPGKLNVPPSPGTNGNSPGAGGGAGITADFNTAKNLYEGGDAASYTTDTGTASSGDYLDVSVGGGGNGGSGSSTIGGGSGDFPRQSKGGKGGSGIVTIRYKFQN